MHPLPNSVSDACVDQLKGISWLPTKLPWSIFFQQLPDETLTDFTVMHFLPPSSCMVLNTRPESVMGKSNGNI